MGRSFPGPFGGLRYTVPQPPSPRFSTDRPPPRPPGSAMLEKQDDTVELLRRWHAGDRLALERLFAKHLEPLHKYVCQKLRRELGHLRRDQDSMDYVQAAAARVLEYTPAFIPANGRQFQQLLRKIVVNDIINRLKAPRNQKRDPSRERFGDSVLDFRPNAHSSLMPDGAALKAEREAEARAWARMALEFLEGEDDRRLVLLASAGELGWKEIGAEVGMEPDTARMRYKRLLPRLANHIRLLREGRVDELLADE